MLHVNPSVQDVAISALNLVSEVQRFRQSFQVTHEASNVIFDVCHQAAVLNELNLLECNGIYDPMTGTYAWDEVYQARATKIVNTCATHLHESCRYLFGAGTGVAIGSDPRGPSAIIMVPPTLGPLGTPIEPSFEVRLNGRP